MVDKGEFLRMYGYTENTPEAEKVWADKVELDNRVNSGYNRYTMVIPDITPYKSMVTGEMIGGRRQHKEHLIRHGVMEVGNEKMSPKPIKPSNIKEDILKSIYQQRK